MFVEKIEVPAFRVLRNVVLEFDPAHTPRVFPLGSENGGGKSTLLQLLFALLHCSSDPERYPYLANLLSTDVHADDADERLIARLTIRLNDEQHVLEFVSLSDGFLKKHLGVEAVILGFLAEPMIKNLSDTIETATRQLKQHQDANIVDWSTTAFNNPYIDLWIRTALGGDPIDAPIPKSEIEMRGYLNSTIKKLERKVGEHHAGLEFANAEFDRIRHLLGAFNYHYVTPYEVSSKVATHRRAIVCRVVGQVADKAQALLNGLAAKIFLLGPSNQQYLFLTKDVRKSLLRAPRRDAKGTVRPQIEYMQHLDEAETKMPGFFAYDWLSIDPLLQLFFDARDADFKVVVTSGRYGDSFTKLMQEVNSLLLGKQVRPVFNQQSNQVIGIEFLVVRPDGQETILDVEDLSQGELKRLMIYTWLRARRAVDAFVLIDEIEASFHPDWQYGIIRDLQEWAPKNQYVLATHSYELCTALTPAHVRTLAPPLRPGQSSAPSE